MPERAVNRTRLLDGLPPEWPRDLLPEIRAGLAAGGRKLVVLDDDPTGTQTVHGVPVLTTWDEASLAAELKGDGPAFFVLTNSRSLEPSAARTLATEIGGRLRAASEHAGVEVEVVSRSDSTLRGHFPGEVEGLAESLGARDLSCLLVPFFLEGGRYTVGDVHYVAEGDELVPAAQTPYARDAVFGYRHSDLRDWVEEKTGGRVPRDQVASLSLEEIRSGGPQGIAARLQAVAGWPYVVVNAAAYRDLEVVAAALHGVEAGGTHFLARTAASWVRTRCGMSGRALLRRKELVSDTANGGLFVVGSYVPKTSAQLAALRGQPGVVSVELDVEALLSEVRRPAEVSRAAEGVNRSLREGRDTVLFTSRRLIAGSGDRENLAIGRQISESLVAVVAGLACPPRYLVAKGGITSSDVATRGLGVRRALVLGQILPGVPVWRLGSETRYPGMAYVVFPGNVGGDEALARILTQLRREEG
jgi:uncharacterized protein YgbK (DUF1537 family)